MAYAALVSLAQTIDKFLRGQDHEQSPISLHEELQMITSSHEDIILLQGFLEDVPAKASSFEERIRGVANEADDILEDSMLEHHRQCYTSERPAAKQGVMYRLVNSDNFRRFKELIREVDSIAEEVMEIKNRPAPKDAQLNDSSSVDTSSSSRLVASTNKDLMVGFEDNLMEIKARLLGESPKLQVIPIFGMGGIGKTTLARNAYDDPLTAEHFYIRAWVTVSQCHSTEQILSSLVVSFEAFNEGRKQRDGSLEEVVYKSLKGRRYLIIMDDIWSTKAWDDVRRFFPDDHHGSRIMLTTRLMDVAAYPDSSSPLHEMPFMDVDQSWNLLRHKVFPRGNCPVELEDIGKMIARSCRGLPLAIVVISRLLSTVSQTPASWENIATNVREAVSRNDDKFPEIILSSSYNNLPHHLRPCFLYMGSFPEDYEIHVSKLIKLWVAEGFLKPSGSKSSEETAEEYLEDLIKRSLVLVAKRTPIGKIRSCSVHDLIRDLCIKKAKEEKFLLHIKDKYSNRFLQKSIRNQRRESILHSGLNCLKPVYPTQIRTVMCFTHSGSCSWDYLSNIKLLRVLDVANANVNSFEQFFVFPPQVFELISFDIPFYRLSY